MLNHDAVSSDPEFDRINKVGESFAAEQDHLSRRPTGAVNVVGVNLPGSEKDVTARKAQEPIAVATFGEVEGHRPLTIGPGVGRDVKAEGRGEGTNDVDEWVQVKNGFEQLRTDLARVDSRNSMLISVIW